MAKLVLPSPVFKGKVSRTHLNGKSAFWCVVTVLWLVANMAAAVTPEQYLEERRRLVDDEHHTFTGANITLNENEIKVNQYLLKLKKEELEESYKEFSKFLPAQNFLLAKSKIEQSKVFHFIKQLPKGASLHTHMLAAVNIDYVISNMTYLEDVYGCNNSLNVFKLKVLENPKDDGNCSWKSLKTYRKEYAAKNLNFDAFLKYQMTLSGESVNDTRERVWAKFKNTFSTLFDLVAYKPFFKKYMYQILEELYQDNIIYTELRGTFLPLYELNGTTYDPDMFFRTFIETVDEFKSAHPDFVGAKYIHSIYRGVDNTTMRTGLEQLIYYKSIYPNAIAGFDFVGLEEDGKDLVDFYEELLGVSKDLKFFFHAGESNQFGRTDLNLADAILLNASRIGHGFALAKHPKLLEVARKKNTAIELSPISNQVLKLNEDPRNHPATVLLSKGHPVVVCNDDPSAWEASGLSFDWYVVFMSMTWEDHGLTVLKKLAQDSIMYSSLSDNDKSTAFRIWQTQWDKFIEEMVNNAL